MKESADVTVVRGGTVLAWEDGRHRAVPGGELVHQAGRILHAGPPGREHADIVVDASGCLVVPGLVSGHAHIGLHAGDRMLLDHGRFDFPRTGFLNYAPLLASAAPRKVRAAELHAGARYGVACLLSAGVTTAVDAGGAGPDAARAVGQAAAEAGMRLYRAPVVSGGRYTYDLAGHLHREIDEAGALEQLAAAEDFIAEHGDEGLQRGILVLDEFFNSTPALLRAIRAAADRLGVRVTMHFSEQLHEFHDCVSRWGRTPVEHLDDCRLLGPDVLLAHALYVTGHSCADRPGDSDLRLLARSGATVVHSPIAVARRGSALESFRRYREHGVRLAMGTDSYPLDMLSEMRWAMLLGRMVDGSANAVQASDVLLAATACAADALGRPDLGRRAAGARADFLLVDLADSRFGAGGDPVEALVACATRAQVREVHVEGRRVVDRGAVQGCPVDDVLDAARAAARAAWDAFPQGHWTGKHPLQLYPASYPPWGQA